MTSSGGRTIQSVRINVDALIDHGPRRAAVLKCGRVVTVTQRCARHRSDDQREMMSDVARKIDSTFLACLRLPETAMEVRRTINHPEVWQSLRASVDTMPALGDACIVVTPDSLLRWMIFHSPSAINGAHDSHSVVVTRTR